MKALVDTSVWLLALRRKREELNSAEKSVVAELAVLIQEGRATTIGLIRQELLSGLKSVEQYERLRLHLRSFPDEALDTADFEEAAKVGNTCRTKGIGVSVVDALICAVALKRDWTIFTTDLDFRNYSMVLPIKLHSPRN